MEIGGTSHDLVTQTSGTSGVTLGGILSLSTISNFDDEVLAISTYTIFDGASALTGAFSNGASGSKLTTLDHGVIFLEQYSLLNLGS